jgi:sec-independent protein translocase protein TatC
MPKNNEMQMSFLAHLDDLRKHLFKTIIGIVIFSLITSVIAEPLLEILAKPIGGLSNLQAFSVTESFTIIIKTSILSGFIFSFPYTLYQILGFVFPALNAKEKRMVLFFFPFAILLFVAGVLFAYYVMLPAAIPFLIGTIESVNTLIQLELYFNFTLSLIFWLGVSFETPILILILAKLKIVNTRMLIKNWRIAIVIIAILAAVITPTGDPINMGLFMAPLIVLYLISILFAAFV